MKVMNVLKAVLGIAAVSGSLFFTTGAASASTHVPSKPASAPVSPVYCPRGVDCIRHCPPVYHPALRYRYCLPYCPPGYRLHYSGRYWYCTPYRPWPPRCNPRPGFRCPLPEVQHHQLEQNSKGPRQLYLGPFSVVIDCDIYNNLVTVRVKIG